MTTGHVFIATSLDGFIARKDHQLDWLMKQNTDGQDHGYDGFIDSVDGVVMGRATYEKVLTFGDWSYKKPVVVMSKTLAPDDIPAALQASVSLVDLDPPELMQYLQDRGWSRAYIDGGKVIQSFIRCGLIDDIILTTVPILIGNGCPLFGEIDGDIDLELLGSTAFASGLVQSHYRLLDRAITGAH